MSDLPEKKYSNLLKNLLSAVDDSIDSLEDGRLLSGYDWSSNGVEIPYAIFFTGRCGSTWLTSLIKETGLAGHPEEFLNEGVATYYDRQGQPVVGLNDYFGMVVKREQTYGKFGIEIDSERLRAIVDVIDIASLFSSLSAVTFFMYRRDIIAQAYSWAAARKSGLWHVGVGEDKDKTVKANDLPTLSELCVEIVRIRKNEEFLEKFFEDNGLNPVYIEYETLVTDPIGTLCGILTNLSVPSADIKSVENIGVGKTKPLVYEEKYSVLIDFHKRFESAIRQLVKNRNTLTSAELEALFKG